MSSPFTRHLKKEAPPPWWLKILSYISTGLVLIVFGVFMAAGEARKKFAGRDRAGGGTLSRVAAMG